MMSDVNLSVQVCNDGDIEICRCNSFNFVMTDVFIRVYFRCKSKRGGFLTKISPDIKKYRFHVFFKEYILHQYVFNDFWFENITKNPLEDFICLHFVIPGAKANFYSGISRFGGVHLV